MNGYDTWTIDVPGQFSDAEVFLDLEMRKVPSPEGFRMKNGMPLSRRWRGFLAGVARAGQITIIEDTGDEEWFLIGVRQAIGASETVVYRAGRRIDEMILKGRFTYARRPEEDTPFFPAMPGAEDLKWVRLGAEYAHATRAIKAGRSPDLPSKEVPERYLTDPELVMIHLLRDVVEVILLDGAPDHACETWCRRVLADQGFARYQVYGRTGES